MLLRWVLTRNRAAVLEMAEDYGTVLVELPDGSIGRVRPKSWDDVVREHSIDDTLAAEERITRAVVAAELEVIPAQREIYRSLRRGELTGCARLNGSGDIVQVNPIQWAALRFRSYNGRDIAIPVDSEHKSLLPRALSDYLNGVVPATSSPAAYTDPLFSAEQATTRWPGNEANSEEAPSATTLSANQPDIRPPSREKPFWPNAHAAASDWLDENGCPEPRDGNQARLEEHMTNWLETHGHEASESTVRRHVGRCINEFRVTRDRKAH